MTSLVGQWVDGSRHEALFSNKNTCDCVSGPLSLKPNCVAACASAALLRCALLLAAAGSCALLSAALLAACCYLLLRLRQPAAPLRQKAVQPEQARSGQPREASGFTKCARGG
jgi:hypothetical protein